MAEDCRLTADNTADLEKLTDMIFKLLGIAWGDDWGVFSEESPTDNDPTKAPMPHITYNLVDRVHTEKKTVKWQQFASKPDPFHKGETITQYKCWFTCQVNFTIYDDTNRGARKTAQRFEEFMETYIGYFKQEGISEIIFKSEKAPDVNSSHKQDIPYRTLCYEVRIERILTISSYDLHRVDVILRDVNVDANVVNPDGTLIDTYQSEFQDENPVKTHLGASNFLDLYNKNFPSQKGGN